MLLCWKKRHCFWKTCLDIYLSMSSSVMWTITQQCWRQTPSNHRVVPLNLDLHVPIVLFTWVHLLQFDTNWLFRYHSIPFMTVRVFWMMQTLDRYLKIFNNPFGSNNCDHTVCCMLCDFKSNSLSLVLCISTSHGKNSWMISSDRVGQKRQKYCVVWSLKLKIARLKHSAGYYSLYSTWSASF